MPGYTCRAMDEQRTTAAGQDEGVEAEMAQDLAAERRTSIPGNVARGALIGVVETVPGVSGGTVALVVGIFHHLIGSAAHVVSAARRLITGPDRAAGAREHLGAVHWRVVLPVAIGMVFAVFTVAGPMADLVEAHPELTRAAFFGMVLASIAVPMRMVRDDLRARGAGRVERAGVGLRPFHVVASLLAAVATFLLVSLPPTSVEAHPLIILPAAMIAVSALVLPGLSGSFLLLTFGLYEPTLRAVESRDLGYLGIFVLGMVLGMVVIVKVLKWLLEHRHTITLVVLTGVMVGGLRSLWPWQTEARELLAPGEDWAAALGLGIAGFVLVAVLVAVDSALAAKDRRAG